MSISIDFSIFICLDSISCNNQYRCRVYLCSLSVWYICTMPRVSASTNYLLEPICHAFDSLSNRFSIPSLITNENETLPALSPSEIDQILSRKLYEQSARRIVDSELTVLIDRFFNLTYQNTIPMVNLLATAVSHSCRIIEKMSFVLF